MNDQGRKYTAREWFATFGAGIAVVVLVLAPNALTMLCTALIIFVIAMGGR